MRAALVSINPFLIPSFMTIRFAMRGTALAVLFGGAVAVRADVKLPVIFGDHMVLQQDVKLPVWGHGRCGGEGEGHAGRQAGGDHGGCGWEVAGRVARRADV